MLDYAGYTKYMGITHRPDLPEYTIIFKKDGESWKALCKELGLEASSRLFTTPNTEAPDGQVEVAEKLATAIREAFPGKTFVIVTFWGSWLREGTDD